MEQLGYVDLLPLAAFATNTQAEKYNKLQPHAYGTLRILHVTKHTIIVSENSIPNTSPVGCATPVASTAKTPRSIYASDRSFENKWTV